MVLLKDATEADLSGLTKDRLLDILDKINRVHGVGYRGTGVSASKARLVQAVMLLKVSHPIDVNVATKAVADAGSGLPSVGTVLVGGFDHFHETDPRRGLVVFARVIAHKATKKGVSASAVELAATQAGVAYNYPTVWALARRGGAKAWKENAGRNVFHTRVPGNVTGQPFAVHVRAGEPGVFQSQSRQHSNPQMRGVKVTWRVWDGTPLRNGDAHSRISQEAWLQMQAAPNFDAVVRSHAALIDQMVSRGNGKISPADTATLISSVEKHMHLPPKTILMSNTAKMAFVAAMQKFHASRDNETNNETNNTNKTNAVAKTNKIKVNTSGLPPIGTVLVSKAVDGDPVEHRVRAYEYRHALPIRNAKFARVVGHRTSGGAASAVAVELRAVESGKLYMDTPTPRDANFCRWSHILRPLVKPDYMRNLHDGDPYAPAGRWHSVENAKKIRHTMVFTTRVPGDVDTAVKKFKINPKGTSGWGDGQYESQTKQHGRGLQGRVRWSVWDGEEMRNANPSSYMSESEYAIHLNNIKYRPGGPGAIEAINRLKKMSA